jgi:hypothetical protein
MAYREAVLLADAKCDLPTFVKDAGGYGEVGHLLFYLADLMAVNMREPKAATCQ